MDSEPADAAEEREICADPASDQKGRENVRGSGAVFLRRLTADKVEVFRPDVSATAFRGKMGNVGNTHSFQENHDMPKPKKKKTWELSTRK